MKLGGVWRIWPYNNKSEVTSFTLLIFEYLVFSSNSQFWHIYQSDRLYICHTHTHSVVYDQSIRGLLLFFPLSLYLRHSHRLCTRTTSEDRWEQRTDSRGPIVPIEKCPQRVWPYKLTHTHTHKLVNTGKRGPPINCSSFVYTLTFSQHLSYVLYTFGKRGPFSNWGPYCSFCYKSPVWMPKQTHTHTPPTHRVPSADLCRTLT